MPETWRKALGAILSVVLTAGLFPCVAWGVPSQVDDSEGGIAFGQTIACGGDSSAAIKEDGTLWTWGYNRYGQLGCGLDGSVYYQVENPTQIMDNAKSVSLGNMHSAAIREDGSLWVWGLNDHGQVGDGSSEQEINAPVKVMDNVASVSLGGSHSSAITKDGSLWTWGLNDRGQLGDGTTEDRGMPVKVMDGVASVSLGASHSAAIKQDGSLWIWGDNSHGQLGDETTESRITPVKVMDGVVSVSLGSSYSAAIRGDGSLWAWGLNNYGQLGDGTTEDRGMPVKVMDGVASVSLGATHSAAIAKDGSLWTWGFNSGWGKLGDGTTEDRSTPVKVMDGVASVSLGRWHSAAVKSDGSLWTWGLDEYGQLGRYYGGAGSYRRTPTELMDGVAISSGCFTPIPDPDGPKQDDEIPSSPFAANVTFNVSGGSGYATTSVNWDDAWFNTSSYRYNHDLATTAAALAASAYTEKNIEAALRDGLGFDSCDPVERHPSDGSYDGNYDQVGYSIETRATSNGVPIIAVIVRGTPGNGEWLSNLNVADTPRNSSQETHEGFALAASKVLETFKGYVGDNDIDLDKARVLITGHSRGASVANILGAELNDGKGDVNGALSPERIYDFTFESPTTTLSSSRKSSSYDNIFNIVNPEDVITRVPLREWGYGRYGRDLVLPSRSNTDRDVYKALLSEMNGYFEGFSGETFQGYLAGTLTASAMSAEICALAPTTWMYYNNYLVGVPPRDMFGRVVKAAIMGTADANDYAILSSALVIPQYNSILTAVFGTGVLNGAFVTGKGVVHGHTQETYVSWMKSAHAALGELPSIFTHENYRTVKVACPVDVKAYDAEGNLVASIANDEVDESLLEDGLPAAVTADGTKMVDLPADGSYRIEVTATDAGEMDVTVEGKDGSGDAPVSVKSYQGVALKDSDAFALEAPATSDPDDCVLVENASGEEAQTASTVSGADIEKAVISVSADGNGSVWGGGEVVKNGKAAVHALAADGWAFVGWERQAGSSDRESVAGGPDLEVRAAEDATYTAVFEPQRFAIAYHLDGGVNGANNPAFYTAGTSVELVDPIKEGYEFRGWFSDQELTERVTEIDASRTGDIDLWAKWAKRGGGPKPAPTFPDVDYSESSWYGKAVTYVAERGLITGYTDGEKAGKFGVGDSLTRAQLATILWRNACPDEYASYDPETAVDTTGIDGSADGMYYTAAANWAVRNGVITGFEQPDGTFDFAADDNVSFEQLITILSRLCATDAELSAAGSDLSAFADGYLASDWSRGAFAWAADKGLVQGYDEPAGKFLRPGEPVARERVAVVLMRAFEMGLLK